MFEAGALQCRVGAAQLFAQMFRVQFGQWHG
jgi:hypothetical protein